MSNIKKKYQSLKKKGSGIMSKKRNKGIGEIVVHEDGKRIIGRIPTGEHDELGRIKVKIKSFAYGYDKSMEQAISNAGRWLYEKMEELKKNK